MNFIIIILFFVILFLTINIISETFNNIKIDIVISRFNEDIKYLNDEPFNQFNITVYNKGPYEINYLDNAKILTLPNVGRESHTYLHHIIKNYDTLPDIIIFLPGSCLAENKKRLTYFKIKKVLETKKSVFGAFKERINYDFALEDNINSNKANTLTILK